jgi:hypothetical protein
MLNHSRTINKSEAVRNLLSSLLFIATLRALGGQQRLPQINFFSYWSTFVVKMLARLLKVLAESILTYKS